MSIGWATPPAKSHRTKTTEVLKKERVPMVERLIGWRFLKSEKLKIAISKVQRERFSP